MTQTKSVKLLGSQNPSVRIAPEYVESDGINACKILRSGQTILDEWQALVLDDWLGRTASGRWASTTCGGSVPRQNGKTKLMQGRAAIGMLMYNEQVIYTAHLQKTATETFEELRDFFELPALKKFVRKDGIKTALGREQIILKSGARIKFLARTRNGGRGQHGDLLIIDEAQELDAEAQASFLPAISASLNPQTIYLGTPPDLETPAVVFRGIRERALSGDTKRMSWFEFSVDEIGDVKDETRWAQTNPALGKRILIETIRGESEQMSPEAFARERLGYWEPKNGDISDFAISEELWDSCKSKDTKPDGKTAYGVKFTYDGAIVALCGAVIGPDGKARISLIEKRTTDRGINWLADWLNARSKKAACVVIDGFNGVDLLIDKISDNWKMKGSIIKVNAGNVIAAVSNLENELTEKTVTWYELQEELRNSALTSTRRKISKGYGYGGDNSAPIEAAALALWGVRTTKRDPSRKMRIG